MSERVDILTPVGRLVQGHPFDANNTNMEGQPLTDKAGNPRVEYFFAVAIPKTDPAWPALWQKVQEVAQKGFPSGESGRPTFSWKYTDGDTVPDKEGFAGCHVIKLKSSFAPRIFTKGGAAQIVDSGQIKRGDYVRVYLSVAPNGSSVQPGIYLNPSMVELVGYGEEIASGPAGDAVFGGAPVGALPAGASETPTAGAPIAQPSVLVAPAPVAPAPVAPAPAPVAPPVAPAAPAATVQPAADFLKPVTPKATAEGLTYDALKAANWTDEQMRASGYIV